MDPSTVSAAKRGAQIVASILFCFTIAGLVFGFAALKPILEASGVYSQLCAKDEGRCKAQDTRLNLLFIVASSANNIAALPMGTYLDLVGPRTASITGGLIFGAGCVIFSLDVVRGYLDTYLIGYTLMALGAPAMFLAQFHLSNAFPARSGLILGAITGAFDASSLPLCFFKVAFFATGGVPSLKQFFRGYTIIPLLLIIQQIAFGPRDSYSRTTPPDSASDAGDTIADADADADEGSPAFTDPFMPNPALSRPHMSALNSDDAALSSAFSRRSSRPQPTPDALRRRRLSSAFSRVSYALPEDADEDEVRAALLGARGSKTGAGKGKGGTGAEGEGEGDGVVGAMFGCGVREQLGSSWFWAMELMILVHMTRINWYLTTVGNQLVYYTGDEQLADYLETAFIFLLPLGGLLSIPAIGYLLDTRPMTHVIFSMATLAFFFGALTMLRSTIAQLVGIGMLVVFRPLFYTAISDYAAKVFGFETFGTVYGLAMALSGAFGLILTPLDILTKTRLHGSFTPINSVLLALGVIAALVLTWRVRTPPVPRIRLEGEEGEAGPRAGGGRPGESGWSVRQGAIAEEDE